jgi:hypothetical protein
MEGRPVLKTFAWMCFMAMTYVLPQRLPGTSVLMACVLESSVRLAPSRWYHVELSVQGNVAAIRVDGTVVATAEIPPREWNLSRPIRLSGYAWEPPDQKGYFGNHGFFSGELRDISLSDA